MFHGPLTEEKIALWATVYRKRLSWPWPRISLNYIIVVIIFHKKAELVRKKIKNQIFQFVTTF